MASYKTGDMVNDAENFTSCFHSTIETTRGLTFPQSLWCTCKSELVTSTSPDLSAEIRNLQTYDKKSGTYKARRSQVRLLNVLNWTGKDNPYRQNTSLV